MPTKRVRRKTVVINPLTSRNKWAVRGRGLAFFLMSILFTVASSIVEAMIIGARVTWRLVLGWCQSYQEKRHKTSEAEIAKASVSTLTIKNQQTESDDVVEALRSLGCSLAEARKAATSARQSLGGQATDEELVKEALRSFASRAKHCT